MSWLSNLFATRRELKRLAKERDFWQAQAVSAEANREKLFQMLLATNQVWADRLLTAKGSFPISQEVKQIVEDTPEHRKVEYETALNEFLLDKQMELERDALEANLPVGKGTERFRSQEAFLKAQFEDNWMAN